MAVEGAECSLWPGELGGRCSTAEKHAHGLLGHGGAGKWHFIAAGRTMVYLFMHKDVLQRRSNSLVTPK